MHLWTLLNIMQNWVWTELDDLDNLIDGPWCIGGDFNEIHYSTNRNGNSRLNRHTQYFHEWISVFSLIDLPVRNLHQTWSNFRENASCGKIDRFFVSPEWLEKVPNTHSKGLPRPVSDHVPLMVDINHPIEGLFPFRFENMWLITKISSKISTNGGQRAFQEDGLHRKPN